MSTLVTLYQFSGDERVLDKSGLLTQLAVDVALVPSAKFDLLNPTFTLKITGNNNTQNWRGNANYLYISEWGRYYFIDNLAVAPGDNILIASCREDVLYSFKDQIVNFEGFAVRSQSVGMNYITDNKIPVDPNRVSVYNMDFGSPFSTNLNGAQYVLTVN